MSEAEAAAEGLPRGQRAATERKPRKRLRSPLDNQRAAFLRKCRSRIKPTEVGLPQAQRTRTAGLRREDVAALSGVSASWYTWLEQGRAMRVSDEVLERLCQTLRLSDDERTYLFCLVQNRAPQSQAAVHPEAPPDIVRMINSLTVPAIAMNLRWDVLAWNPLNSVFYRDYDRIPPSERNLLEILLTQPVRHMNSAQMEETAERLVARLRFDYSRCTNDPKFEALVHRLNTRSPLFNRLWRTPEFTLRAFGLHRFTHARYGRLAFEHTSCVPDGHPNVRVVICTPDNPAAKRAVAQVSAELAASTRDAALVPDLPPLSR
ncbi:MAG: helix-turn-helix transcriptional regulator [Steroidobacteraceae bacterium]